MSVSVQAAVNLFLSGHLPDRFTADIPIKEEDFWRVSVIVTYPTRGNLGRVGAVKVDNTGKILEYTPVSRMKARGLKLISWEVK